MSAESPIIKRMQKVDWTLAYLVAAAIGVVSMISLATAPLTALLGDSSYAIPSALHGVAATLYLLVGTVLAYMGYRLYVGGLATTAFRDLRALAGLGAFFSLVTVVFGNWIYIFYRAPAGARAYFLEGNPAVHQIFFEFKEFAGLFTLPLAFAAAFVLWRERDRVADQPRLCQAVGVLLILGWIFLFLAFALGAAVTKLRAV